MAITYSAKPVLTARPPLLRGFAAWPWWIRFALDPLGCFSAMQRRFGPVCGLGNPLPFSSSEGRRFFFVAGGEVNRQVLGQPDLFRPGGQILRGPKGSAHRRLRHGILAMHGEQHRTHRRLMQPPCLKPAVATYTDTIAALVDQVLGTWEAGRTVDMYREMRTLSNWVAAHILFGNENFEASIRLGQTIEEWLLLDARARSTFMLINVPGTPYHALLKKAEQLEKELFAAIERNRKTRNPGSDMLSILIRALDNQEAGMSETDLLAHAAILYAASFETTANALTWTLFLIAQHPRVAAALHAEIAERLDQWPPSGAQLDSLPLLEGVLLESLRLLPPVAYTLRTATKDLMLDELSLRSGDKLAICHFLTHRDPGVFAEPNRFDPWRWSGKRPDPFQYVPFSASPRLCLGYSFALLELKLTVARVMQRFRLGVVPDALIDGVIQLTLRPRNGVPMIVHAQDGAFAAAPVTGNIHQMVDMTH
jgi:cytochrome P450